jgi:hypothetical protein
MKTQNNKTLYAEIVSHSEYNANLFAMMMQYLLRGEQKIDHSTKCILDDLNVESENISFSLLPITKNKRYVIDICLTPKGGTYFLYSNGIQYKIELQQCCVDGFFNEVMHAMKY